MIMIMMMKIMLKINVIKNVEKYLKNRIYVYDMNNHS